MLVVRQRVHIRFGQGHFRRLAQDRAAARVRVLHIRAAFTVEIQRAIPAEINVLDSVVAQIGIDNRANADLTRDVLLVRQIRGFFVDDVQRLLLRLFQQIFQIDDVPLAGGERLPLVGNHAERDMHAVLRPFVSHLFQHTENLAEVQILLIRHDVQALIE